MAKSQTSHIDGHMLLRLLKGAPVEELDLDAAVLLDLYDVPRCQDCGAVHSNVWSALVCDGLTDARRRGEWARRPRQRALVEDRERHAQRMD